MQQIAVLLLLLLLLLPCKSVLIWCRWYRPGPPFVPVKVLDFVRKVLGFVPLTMWGRFGSPVPHKVRITLV